MYFQENLEMGFFPLSVRVHNPRDNRPRNGQHWTNGQQGEITDQEMDSTRLMDSKVRLLTMKRTAQDIWTAR